ncbi:MAG: hypothetical protein ACI4EV_06300 [Lachnospiraceae bacterium]
MTVVINVIIATIANLIAAFPVYVVPDYKIERRKVVVRFAILGLAVGNVRYFFEPNSMADLILIIIGNITWFLAFLPVLKPKYYKFVIAYGLVAFNCFSGESIAQMLGINFNYVVYDEHFVDGYIVHLFWSSFTSILLYNFLKHKKETLENVVMDKKSFLVIFLVSFFCIISPMYINRIMDRENVSSDVVTKLFVFANIFTLIVLAIIVVRTITVRKKNYILEYNAARQRESTKLSRLIEQNEYAAKLRHDYINQISVAKALAEDEPAKAIDMLDKMKVQYERG